MAATAQSLEHVSLRGAGLTLRAFTAADADFVLACAQDPLMNRWMALSHPLHDIESARAWVRTGRRQARQGAGVRLAVCHDERPAGCVELTLWDDRTANLGYWTAPHARGRGVAAGAARLLSDWALRSGRADRVDVMTLPGNHASERVALRAGFAPDGTWTCPHPRDGHEVTFNVFCRFADTHSAAADPGAATVSS